MIEILSLKDNILGLLSFVILFLLFFFIGVRSQKNYLLKRFYFFAFLIRIFSAYFNIFLFKVVLNSVADTGRYYNHSFLIREEIINGRFSFSNISWSDSTYITGFFAGLISVITPSNYLTISFVFTVFGFIGSWQIYKTFLKIYPNATKELAFMILFLPSLFFWGSGLLKDPLSLFGLGLMFSASYTLFIEYKISIKSILMLIIGLVFASLIKAYIPIVFIPCFLFLIYRNAMLKIKFKVTKFFLFPLIVLVLSSIGYIGLAKFSELNENFSSENAGKAVQSIQQFYKDNPELLGGSSYDIGTISPNISENTKLIPSAFIVTYFRPYIWEAKKILYIPSLYESFISFYFIFYFVLKIGIIQTIRIIKSDVFLQFCLLFSIIFGVVVGLSSFNFGTLMRYKIPSMPFWTTFLIITYQKYRNLNFEKKTVDT